MVTADPTDYKESQVQATSPNYKDESQVQTSPESPVASDLPPLINTTERKLMAKVDWHVVPILCVMYLLAFLDRVNISNAAVLGLKEDLDIVHGTKYNTALTIFFVPYIIFEIPSNILLKKLKPHVWLSLCMFGFGLVMIFQGLVQNWGGLMATRWFLGMFETGLFPGCFYLMGMWYTRSEAQKRFSFFFSSTTLAGAFGGVLAAGIGKMEGVRGYSGWRWVFILEGLATAVAAIICFFLVSDFPEEVKWLSEEERDFLRAKLAKDVGKADHNTSLTFRDVLDVFKDYKVILAGWAYFGQVVTAYGYAYFAPTIIKTYGYDRMFLLLPLCVLFLHCMHAYTDCNPAIKTQLYSIPPWAAAFGFSMCIAYLSDRMKNRFCFALVPMLVAMAGYGILLNITDQSNHNTQYGALFLVTSGCYSAMPVIVCWVTMNFGGHRRRSVGTAWTIGFGNIGGIISTYSFLEKDAPLYRNGYIISLSFLCFSAALCILYLFATWYDNRKRDRGLADGSLTMPTEEEQERLGDMAANYRYLY